MNSSTWQSPRHVVEELGKGLFLVAVVIFRRAELHGPLDGIVYGALVGIGFAFVEDIIYYLQSLESGQLGVTFFLRGIMGPFAHPLFTAATGLGIGIAVATRRPAVRSLASILGFLAAVAMHAIWNGSTFWGGNGFLFAYSAIFLPLLDRDTGGRGLGSLPRGQDAHHGTPAGRADGLDQARRDPLDSPTVRPHVGTCVRQAHRRQARRRCRPCVPADHDRSGLPPPSSGRRDRSG